MKYSASSKRPCTMHMLMEETSILSVCVPTITPCVQWFHCGSTRKGSGVYAYHFHFLGFGPLVFSIDSSLTLEELVFSPMSRKKRIQFSWFESSLYKLSVQKLGTRRKSLRHTIWEETWAQRIRCMLKASELKGFVFEKGIVFDSWSKRSIEGWNRRTPDELCEVHFTTKLPLHQSSNFHC
jgi:hypothetical protein